MFCCLKLALKNREKDNPALLIPALSSGQPSPPGQHPRFGGAHRCAPHGRGEAGFLLPCGAHAGEQDGREPEDSQRILGLNPPVPRRMGLAVGLGSPTHGRWPLRRRFSTQGGVHFHVVCSSECNIFPDTPWDCHIPIGPGVVDWGSMGRHIWQPH